MAVVNPLANDEWNEMLLQLGHGTIFHSANWARLLVDVYGFHPAYITLTKDGVCSGCLPVMEVKSVLTGRRGVCLSFSDYCSSLVENAEEFKLIFDSVREFGRLSGWRYIEFRGEYFLATEKPARSYAHHQIELSFDERLMRSRLRENMVRNIKKAEKYGVTVDISRAKSDVRQFYRLHCLTRRRHGLPPQSVRFFDTLHQHIISPGYGFTALARQGGAVVAGVICLHFGDAAVYKYGASDQGYSHLCGNNLVMWKTMRHCALEGFRTFSLGRTELDNQGLLNFKNGWGAQQTPLHYYRYDLDDDCFVSVPPHDLGLFQAVLKKMPVDVLRIIGTLVYPHLG